jgi:S-adenosyl methyltransferase
VDGGWEPQANDGEQALHADFNQAHSARVYDYWLGGKENYAADRQAAEQIMAARPDIITSVRANRAFLTRAVRYLAAEVGIDQFLDIGAGLPASDNVHEVAQAAVPWSRVVYVDNDPVVLSHARALLHGKAGTTDFVGADLRDTDEVIGKAEKILDLNRPVAITLLMVVEFIPEAEDPYGAVARLLTAMPPGSYLVLSHPAKDIEVSGVQEGTKRYNDMVVTPLTRRTHAEVSRFFDGLELIAPGIVPLDQWRPARDGAAPRSDVPAYGGMARKV